MVNGNFTSYILHLTLTLLLTLNITRNFQLVNGQLLKIENRKMINVGGKYG
jgi:hypothetical protein